MKEIKLNKGYSVQVDDEDFDELSQYNWRIRKGNRPGENIVYACCTILMHKFILKDKKNVTIVDHKDNNGLNNQKSNLRKCLSSQNAMNRRKGNGKKMSSRFKGVCWNQSHKKWYVRICKDYIRIPLGYFDSEIEAAKVYNIKAKEIFGEFARLNEV